MALGGRQSLGAWGLDAGIRQAQAEHGRLQLSVVQVVQVIANSGVSCVQSGPGHGQHLSLVEGDCQLDVRALWSAVRLGRGRRDSGAGREHEIGLHD